MHKPYLRDPSEVVLLPGVREGLKAALDAGTLLFLFTNQSGVGRGWFTRTDVERVNARMIELLELGPAPFAEICIATELPDQPPVYRKPSPKFINEMLFKHKIPKNQALMIGDAPSDWEAAINAGIGACSVCIKSKDQPLRARRLALGVDEYSRLGDCIQAWQRRRRDAPKESR